MTSRLYAYVVFPLAIGCLGAGLAVWFWTAGVWSPEPSDHPDFYTQTAFGEILITALAWICLPTVLLMYPLSWLGVPCGSFPAFVTLQAVTYFLLTLSLCGFVRLLRQGASALTAYRRQSPSE